MTNLDEMMPDHGPSARFPRLSAAVPLEALLLASDAIVRHTDRWLGVLTHDRRDLQGIRHVTRLYDLRTRGEDWECKHCGTHGFVLVPGDISQRWVPRAGEEEAAAYAQHVTAFIGTHAMCEMPR